MSTGLDKIKAWMFPGLITILAAIVWNDVREIKADVKALIAQSNVDKTRIDNLERAVFDFSGRQTSLPEKPERSENPLSDVYFVRPEHSYNKKKIYRPYIASNN